MLPHTLASSALLLSLVAAGSVAAQTRPTPAESVRTLLEQQRVSAGFPGASVAWVGRSSEGATAVGDLQPEQRLMSGSIGKTYVAALAVKLAAAGKLGLDDQVAAHLDVPWLARVPNGAAVTIRQLLRHQSGIPEHVWRPDFEKALRADLDRTWKPEELLAFVFDMAPLFAPGEGWSYADTNYVLLGAVLEKVGGAPCFEQVQEQLLDPLDLKDTAANLGRTLPGLANGHTTGLLGFPPGDTIREGRCIVNPQFEYCGGGMSSTPDDLARWCRALYGSDFLSVEHRAAMRDGVPSKTGPGHRYGLGTMILDTAHGRAVGHSGVMIGYLSMMLYYEDLDLAVAIQFDTDNQRKLGQSLQKHLDAIVGALRAEHPAGAEKSAPESGAKPERRGG